MLIEREPALERLSEAYREATRGIPGIVTVLGPVGTGKTELLRHFGRQCTKAGAEVLGAVLGRREGDISLGALRQVLDRAALPPADRGAAAASLASFPGDEPVPVPALETLVQVLAALARVRPTVVVLDDVQFCDAASLQVLFTAVRRPGTGRLLLVLAEREQLTPRHPLLYTEIARHPHRHAVRLRPLTPAGLGVLVRERDPDGSFAARLGELSGGNPLLVRALLEDTERAGPGSSPSAPTVGDAHRTALLTCLHRGEPQVLGTARALAVLGEAAPPGVVARLASLPVPDVEQALAALTRAGLIHDGWFRGPAAAGAVAADLASGDRAAWHRRAALVLNEEGASSARVAHHLAAAGSAPEPWGAGVLHAVARDLLGRGLTHTPVAYLTLARRAVTGPAETAQITATLARALWRVDPTAALRHTRELGEAVASGDLRGEEALVPVQLLLWAGRAREAFATLAVLSEHDDDPGRPDLAATPRALNVRALLGLLSPDLLAGVPGEWVLGETVAATPADAVAGIEEFLHVLQLGDDSLARIVAAIEMLVHAGRSDLAQLWSEEFLTRAEASESPSWEAVFAALTAGVATAVGDLDEAVRMSRRALEALAPEVWGPFTGSLLGIAIMAATASGDREWAEQLLALPVPPLTFQTVPGLYYLQARGRHHLQAGRSRTALDDFLACGRLMRRWGLDRPGLVAWRAEAAEAHLELGRHLAARDLLARQLAELEPGPSRVRGRVLRLQARLEPPARAVPLLETAVGELERCDDRLELARALAALAAAQQEAGDREPGRRTAARALALAGACGARGLQEELRGLTSPAAPGPVPPSPAIGAASLTDAERGVAVLAAQGRTNREIAAGQFITVSTVEQHLTRVYRKLGLRGRSELRRAMTAPRRDAGLARDVS